jgi:hypothetical protein
VRCESGEPRFSGHEAAVSEEIIARLSPRENSTQMPEGIRFD